MLLGQVLDNLCEQLPCYLDEGGFQSLFPDIVDRVVVA